MNTTLSLNTQTAAIEALKQLRAQAFGAMEEAWHAQSRTTVDDGYTQDQAEAAIRQAMDAQRHYDATCRALEMAYAAEDALMVLDFGDLAETDEQQPSRVDLYPC